MDVVTFGETMVLFNPETEGPLRSVGTFTKSTGGAESNVAIALARLGHRAGRVSKLGRDEFGTYIKSTVKGAEVAVCRRQKEPRRTTGSLLKEELSTVHPMQQY